MTAQRLARGAVMVLGPMLVLAHAIQPAAPATAPIAVDAAASAGIAELTDSWSAPVGDVDRDGWQDVFIVRHQQSPRLYRNLGDGTFGEVPHPWPLVDRHDCVWGDVNVDRLDDLYCSLGGEQGTGYVPNELWIHQPDHTFVEQAASWGVEDPYGRGRRVTFVDANGDAFPDLFVGNQFPRSDGNLSTNRLFLNEGGVGFRSAPEWGVDLEVGGRCAVAADVDGDGWQDLFVCGQDSLRVYRNQQGSSFQDVTASLGLSGRANMVALHDLDGDLDLDLILVRQKALLVKPQVNGSFSTTATTVTLDQGNSLATGDVNRDGAIDVYVVQGCSNGSNVPDLMLANTGEPFGYAPVSIPQATEGCGDVASAIDHDRNGTTDFVVLNAAASSDGPVQLISFADAPPSPSPSPDPTVSPSPDPTVSPSPDPPPASPSVSTLTAYASTLNRSSHTTSPVTARAGRVLIAVVASQATPANSRAPTVSGLGVPWVAEGGTEGAVGTKSRLRLDVFRAVVGSDVTGSVVATYDANQTDVHVHVVAVGGSAGVGTVSWASSVGTTGTMALAGADPSRTLASIAHAADEPATPGAGLTELADTDLSAKPSGLATAWGADGFVGAPAMTWATSSRWIGVALVLAPAS